MNRDLKIWGRVINWALFYFGWALCIWGVVHQMPWLGVTAAGLIVAAHLIASCQRSKDCLLIFGSCTVGALLDSFYQASHLIQYESPNMWFPELAPLWIISLYALLAICVDHSMGWLKGRVILSALFGAVGGVFSYMAGIRAGVATISSDSSLVIIALAWLLFFPLLVHSSLWLDRRLPSRNKVGGPLG